MGKGSNFERQICKSLSLWWTNDTRDDIFWRSTQSGGRATSRAKKGRKTAGSYGDITNIDPSGQRLLDKCCLELKRGYAKWSFLDVLDQLDPRKGQKKKTLQTFEGFVEQATKDTYMSPAQWTVIIAQRDKRKSIICLDYRMYTFIKIMHEAYDGTMINIRIKGRENSFVCMRYDKFLQWCPSEIFRKRRTR